MRVKIYFRRALLVILAGLVSSLCLSCDLMAKKPPFVYGDAAIRIGSIEGYQERIGLTFALHNNTDVEISRIQVKFKLYDIDGMAIPEFGQNEINETIDCEFLPDSDQVFITSLDEFFYYAPSGEYIAEDFQIPYISFSDGSEWRDSFDLFKRPGAISSEVIQ
jgi:hypothetical protein